MTLDPTAKLAVIEGSIRQYVMDTLGATFTTTTTGDALDFGGGEPFQDTLHAAWLQVRLLQPARPRSMVGPTMPDGSYGRELFHMLNLNIFMRPAKLVPLNSLRLQTLRDIVTTYFVPNRRIPVKDYAAIGDDATIGNLIVFESLSDVGVLVPEREIELLQWNNLVSLRWSEKWSVTV